MIEHPTYASSWPKRASGGTARLGEAAGARVRVRVEVQERRSAVGGVCARLSWGLFSSLVWRGRRGRAHLMGPVRVPGVGVLLPLEEADIGTVRLSEQKYAVLHSRGAPWGRDCQ